MGYRLFEKKKTETTFSGEILNWQNKWIKLDFIRCVNGDEITWCRKENDGYRSESTPDEDVALEIAYQKYLRENKLNRILNDN